MKIVSLLFALSMFVMGCATLNSPSACSEKASYARGVKDADSGVAYAPKCEGAAAVAYREGFDSRKKRKPSSVSRRLPVLPAWVCEVESSAKVFTGVGESAEEASRSAQETCSTHFQSSSCTNAECSRSL